MEASNLWPSDAIAVLGSESRALSVSSVGLGLALSPRYARGACMCARVCFYTCVSVHACGQAGEPILFFTSSHAQAPECLSHRLFPACRCWACEFTDIHGCALFNSLSFTVRYCLQVPT